MKRCLRCGQDSDVSAIGEALFNFVCDICRQDKNGWEFNGLRTSDMEYESPESAEVKQLRIEKYERNELR